MYHSKIIFFILISFTFLHSPAQKVKIALNLNQDFSWQTELSSSISFTQEFMGIIYTTDTKISNVFNTKVTGTSNSSYNCIANYSQMEFFMKSLLMDLDMSSESADTTNPMNIMMRSIVNNDFRQILSKDGTVREIQGLDLLISENLKKIHLEEEQKEEFKKNFLDSFGEKAIMENNLQNSVLYSDSLVSAGDKWFRSMTISPYGIPMHLLLDIKLKEVANGNAIFITEGMLAARMNSEANGRSEQTPSYDLSGSQVSEIKINLKNGIIEKSITTQYIQGKVSAPDNNAQGKYIEIPLKIVSRSTITSRPVL
jgi:hypothetical protein